MENSGLPDDQATSCETHGRSLKDTAVFVSGGWTALCRRRNELRARRAALDSYMTTTLFYEPDCSTSSRRLATLSARLCSWRKRCLRYSINVSCRFLLLYVLLFCFFFFFFLFRFYFVFTRDIVSFLLNNLG